ncbi:MAG: hypothetical protein QOF77_278 [Solirubrobacteraceae bacterium]|nr:hypothetical protein [Solirubrobacteraceae bacterium]
MADHARSMPRPRSIIRPPLRAWQVRALAGLEDWSSGPFLISAAPGAGKTRPALELAERLLAAGSITRVAVVAPTTPLTRQWAAAAARLGLHLAPDATSPSPPRDFDGVAVTYARIAGDARRWARGASAETLVIADEAHHLGEDLAWGTSFAVAFAGSPRRLLLSGTPFRSDATPIPGVRYDGAGLAEPDVSYSYADAVADGICRRVTFITYDGALSWRSGADVIESSFETVLSGREAGRRYRTAISTELPDGLPRILCEANAKLGQVRANGHPDAAALAVAADGGHAREIARLLAEATGRPPVVVLHTEARAAEKLAAFTASRAPWIVAVNMVSEGVDIPRLRVGVYATAAKTPLIFRQIVGRFVRTVGGRPTEQSWLYLPADGVLRRHAAEVERELRHVLVRESDELGEPVERARGERSPASDFEPLSADVAPQLTLFGGGARVTPPTPAPPAATPERAPAAAFERRARLRNERHRLVAELCRAQGRSHAEVNRWINRSLGLHRVEEATIDQLERSVELLVASLTTRRRAPAQPVVPAARAARPPIPGT